MSNVQEKLQKQMIIIDKNGEVLQEVPTQSILPEFAITINEAKERIALLQKFVQEYMVPGQDFGIIPGCRKPSLLKPGAEKLCDVFGFSKHIEVVNRVEDWQQGFFSYEVKATLISKRTGMMEADGVGCCNSREKKYADQNPYTITNTLLKMAKKRAIVDAVLSATRSSGIFTQDTEDLPTTNADNTENSVNPQRQPQATQTPRITKKQLNYLFNLCDQKNLTADQASQLLKQRYNANLSSQLTAKQASDFIDFLKGLK